MTALKSILVMVIAVAIVGGALAVAQPRDRDPGERQSAPRKSERRMPHARLAADLAEKLGVSAAQVRSAFGEVMAENRGGRCEEKSEALAKELGITVDELERAKDAAGRRGPRALAEELGVGVEKLREAMKAAREQRCTDLTNAFAAKLGKGGDEVRAAIRELAAEKLESAVRSGRLSEERAARIRERIASSNCFGLPLGRHHRFGGLGHHRGGMMRRFRHRFRQDGERRDGSFEPRRGDRVPA